MMKVVSRGKRLVRHPPGKCLNTFFQPLHVRIPAVASDTDGHRCPNPTERLEMPCFVIGDRRTGAVQGIPSPYKPRV